MIGISITISIPGFNGLMDTTSDGSTNVWEWESGISPQWESGIFIPTE